MGNRFTKAKWLASAALVGVMAMAPPSAFAELLGYQFTDTRGLDREVSSSELYINPIGAIAFNLRAGVDRKLEVELQNTKGETVEIKRSALIGANDRYTFDGREHYGYQLELGVPADGEYKAIARILGSDESVVEESTYSVTIDTEVPEIGTGIQPLVRSNQYYYEDGRLYTGLGGGSGVSLMSGFSVEGMTDNIGISRYRFYTLRGNTKIEGPWNAGGDSGILPRALLTTLMPVNQADYDLYFEVEDIAGNVSTIKQPINFSTKNTYRPIPVAINTGDPKHNWRGMSGFKEYDPAAKTRLPFSEFVFAVKKEEYIDNNPWGLMTGTRGGNGFDTIGNGGRLTDLDDSNYVYMKTARRPITSHGEGSYNHTFGDQFGNSNSIRVHYDQEEGADLAPVISRYDLYDSNGNIFPSRLGKNDNWLMGYADFEVEARNYPIRLYVTGGGSVHLSPGETQVQVPLNQPVTSSRANRIGQTAKIYMSIDGSEIEGQLRTKTIYVNDYDPEIVDIRLNEGSLQMEVDAIVPPASTGVLYGNYTIRMGEVRTSRGEVISASSIERHDPKLHTLYFDLNRLPEGRHQISEIYIEDRFKNTATESFSYDLVSDVTPPTIQIISDNVIASLDEIVIQVTDNIDENPRVTNARIFGGPADDDVNLATIRQNTSVPTFGLEYPVIFPGMIEADEYTLDITASDANGNISVASTTFTYSPAVVALSTEEGSAIRIPARVAPFLRADGGEVLQSEPLTLSNGSSVAGTYDVYATLRSDAEVPLIINGVRVTPGDTQEIMGRHNFSSSGGRLSIPVMAAEDGALGTSSILVSTTAPNSPVLLVDIETWEGEGRLTGSNREARQVIDPVNFLAQPTSDTYCSFTTRESDARRADAITDPTCYVEWDNLPSEIYPVESRSGENAIPEIEGIGTRIGAQSISYSLYMFGAQGQKVKVGGGAETLNVVSAMNAVVYETDSDYSEVDRVLHEFDLRMSQTSGPTCTPTLTESLARQAAERNGYDPSRRSCFFEWSPVPTGLEQAEDTDVPQLTGFIGSNGQYTLGWKAYIYSPEGFKAPITQQTLEITVKDPEAPTIELDSEYHLEDNLYIVPQNRNSLGGLTIDGLPTDIRVDLRRGQEQIENEVYQAGWGARNRLIRNLRTSHQPVWGETVHQVAAIYEKVPDLRTDASYRVVAAPSDSIQPLVELDSDTVLDTEPLKVRVKVRNMMDFDGDYVPEEMGLWNVRLLNQQSFSNQEPLTEFVEAVNGEFEFEIEMERLSDAGLRLVAEAQLISPIEGYERTVVSRPTYVQVLRGGAIEGDITSRQFTGPAPLTAIFRIALEDRLDQQALGDVIWQISTDDGSSWEEQEIDPRRPMQFYRSFDEGTYLLRAYLYNRNSGAESYTEQVEIVSYAQPEVTINGPGVLFVGDSYTYVAEVEVSEDAIKTADEAVVDWSLDGGKTWPFTGRELELHSDTEDRFPMRARTRMPEAPADDRYAYQEGRLNVDFRNIVSPRVRVRTPTSLEQGIPYAVSATASVPYRGMEYEINGYFTLPDGTRQDGDLIEYIPTAADSELGSATFLYTAWIEGFKDETTATGDRKSRVWQYVWPEFYFTDRVSAPAAPAEVSLSVRHRNGARRLDEPTYNWVLPDAIDELQERGDFTRRFMITEPGTHRIQVEVSDARGHTTTVEQVIELAEPDPYDINLRYTPSNSFMREPLDVRLRPIYRGGHPHDRVNNQRFRVNGEVISEGSNSAVASLNAGRHEVIFEIETSYGVVDEERVFIDVAENQVPTCELETSESSRNWIIRANCVDVDGRVTKYHWMVDGEESARTSNRLGISKKDFDDVMPEVILIAVDDSGGASDPITVQ